MAQQTTERAADQAQPGQPPVPEHCVVPVDRLLTVAVLSPAQAVLVSAAVLAGTASAQDVCAVRVDSDGEVEVTPAPTGAGSEAGELVDRVARNARRLPAHPRHGQLVLLRTLEEVVARHDLRPVDRARLLREELERVLGPHA